MESAPEKGKKESTAEKGKDEYGNKYKSLEEMWHAELVAAKDLPEKVREEKKLVGSREDWYKKSNNYWNNTTKDVSGMLQGWDKVSEPDLKCSGAFLEKRIKEGKLKPGRVIDCGGGIGRIAGKLLVKHFESVDIVDQAENLIKTAKETIKDPHMKNFYVSGLQDFAFEGKYDCIWVQWVLLHMTDEDVVKFLKKCKESVAEGGILVVKENEKVKGFMLDKLDYSITRSEAMHKQIFDKAGLKVVEEILQPDFPEDLVPVKLYALQ